jgi:aminobenzoyl-glutamate utilization protein B
MKWVIPAALLVATCALAPPAAAQSASKLESEAFAIIDANADHMGRLSDAIFSYSEIGFQEVKTIALVKKTLESAGFSVETGAAGMPTAYMAKYGSGSPVLGLMSDFDGVPTASQKPTSKAVISPNGATGGSAGIPSP